MASNIRDIKVNISGDASALKASLKEPGVLGAALLVKTALDED